MTKSHAAYALWWCGQAFGCSLINYYHRDKVDYMHVLNFGGMNIIRDAFPVEILTKPLIH